ncbi:MAG: hypothetical protein BroJett018_08750 [Chloroflexota bacterium]|nr:hypothetical protein [Chloroflexota bacterium]NOG62710.1 hypothetical protein [Chloroflexota bacterium]GIK63081.1 MAG: hypothetical protein BroJett018_08750 [Chloroflexota bacterium]
MDWNKILPVIISIVIIIFVAIVRQYSRTVAAITATMPLNVPLALWIAYSAEDNSHEKLGEFSTGLFIGIIPTVVFIGVTALTVNAGWSIGPVLGTGYLAWGVTLGLLLAARHFLTL